MARGTYQDLIDALGQRESSNNYQSENSAGFIGRYQFGEPALDDAGYYNSRNGARGNSWEQENWTGKNGANSKETFLNTPKIQEQAILDWFTRINRYLNSFDLKKYDGQTLNGVPISISGMLTGNHLVGIGGLRDYLRSGGDNVPRDGNGTPITEYIQLFNDFETPFPVDHSIAEEINGGSGADVLNGLGGNDTLSGSGGDDRLNGDEGNDIARYQGNRDEYDIEFLPDETVRITDRVAGRDGSDTLEGVEQAIFSDRTINLSPGQDISFVIDTTSSMEDDIDAVKVRASEIINSIFDGEESFLNSRIAVVGYNDPGTNTFLSFTDEPKVDDRKTAALNAINSISVSGGDDIPEAVNAGLISALSGDAGEWRAEADVRRIILFGDAPPKDTELRGQVTALASNVNASISGSSLSSLSIAGDIETTNIADNLAVTRFALQTDAPTTTPVEIFTILIGMTQKLPPIFKALRLQLEVNLSTL